MDLLVLGLVPPTDIERRTRDLQRLLYRQLGLLGGLALPVLVPLEVREEVEDAPMRSRPEGRIESARVTTGAFAAQGQWLLWLLRPETDLNPTSLVGGLWADASNRPGGPGSAVGPLPTAAGLLLGCSAGSQRLEESLLLLGSEPPRTFQPHALALYRLCIRAVGVDWEEALAAGTFWEELWRAPVRRPR